MRNSLPRVAALVAAASLSGATLVVAASGAATAAVPAGADVAGVVTAAGAPAANVEVVLRGVNADGTNPVIGIAYTDASGQYWFDINGDDASDGTSDAYDTRQGEIDETAPTQTQFKLRFIDDRTPARGQLSWESEYTGDQPTVQRATPVNRVLGGLTTVPTADLAVDSGAQGTVSVPVPAGYVYTGTVVAYNSDDVAVDSAGFDSDPTDDATDPLDGQLSWEMRDLYPGGDYTFQFFASAEPTGGATPATPEIDYIGSFYGNSTTFDGAKVVDTKPGQFATGINGTLTNVLEATVKPSIEGQVAPGRKVKADHGTWNLTAETTYTYQWLLKGKVVGTDATYTLPKKRALGKKLQLVVTAQNANYSGSVALKPVKVKYGAALKATAKATYVAGKRVVAVRGLVKLKGVKPAKAAKVLQGAKVTVYEVSKSDDSVMVKKARAKVVRGKVSVAVKGLISGRHYLLVDVTGKRFAEITRTFKVKV